MNDEPNGNGPVNRPSAVMAFATRRLHLLAPDGVVTREEMVALGAAGDVLACARREAERIERDAHAEASALRGRVEEEGRSHLAALEDALRARMSLQQATWLAQLQPTWMQALEQALRRLCATELSTHVLAGALEAGALYFESFAGIRIGVHPDDADHARAALALLDLPAVASVRVEADPALGRGTCRMRGRELEITLDLDRAIEIALGTT